MKTLKQLNSLKIKILFQVSIFIYTGIAPEKHNIRFIVLN